jgi:ATP-binding cassette subfamily B protein
MLKQLARSIREYKRPTILTLLFMVGEAVIETAIPFITATYLINVIQRDGSNVDMGYILKIGLILALGAVFSLSFAGLAGFTCAKASAGFAKNLRHDLFGKIQTFSFTNIDNFSSTSLVTTNRWAVTRPFRTRTPRTRSRWELIP